MTLLNRPYFSTKTRGVQKGMGLSLTVCRSIVRHHGGALNLESQPGRGTTVVFHLPATVGRLTGATHSRDASNRRGRILVMDDEKTFRQVIVQTLDRLGYEAELAQTGVEAIALYTSAIGTSRQFDAVMLDSYVHCGLGGAETLRELRRRDPALRAVLLSGHQGERRSDSVAALGFNALLTKPFSTEDLHVVLTHLFRPLEQEPGEGI